MTWATIFYICAAVWFLLACSMVVVLLFGIATGITAVCDRLEGLIYATKKQSE